MSNTKKLLIVSLLLVALGLIIFAVVMGKSDWDFTKLGTFKHESNSYEITEEFNNISIKTNTADIILLPSDDGKYRVDCLERSDMKHSVSVTDGTLEISATDARKWYHHIGFSFVSPRITIYLPEAEYGSLVIDASTGNIEISEGISLASIDVRTSTGDVKCYASAPDFVRIKTSTGDIRITDLSTGELELSVSTGDVSVSGVTCDGEVKANASTGKISLSSITCKSFTSSADTGDISLTGVVTTEKLLIERETGDVELERCNAAKLFITTDTGEVELDRCDADEIFIETDTGDVEGSLLSDKVFIVRTDTGEVDVPKTVTGGRCEITTDTGDIEIKIVGD